MGRRRQHRFVTYKGFQSLGGNLGEVPNCLKPYCRLAIKKACESQKRVRLGAVLLQGRRVVKSSFNNEGKHAEMRVLGKGDALIVSRIKADGTLAMSFPCDNCLEKLINKGIKKIVFTTQEGKWKVKKL